MRNSMFLVDFETLFECEKGFTLLLRGTYSFFVESETRDETKSE